MYQLQSDRWGTITDNTEQLEGVPPAHFDKRAHIRDTKERVLAVYRDVWDEFYDWERVECTNKIKELLGSGSPDPENHRDLDPFEAEEAMEPNLNISSSSCIITNYDETGAKTSCTSVPVDSIPFKSDVDPHPRYQMCVPISRSIVWRNDDPDDKKTVRFFPYADQEGFNIVDYLARFNSPPSLEWENMIDPDREPKFLDTVCTNQSKIHR